MAQPLLNVTELDFDQIKANLKAYFQRQDSPIKDWNYDGSGLNMLLDVLAYNTHYNAILAHLNLNESFIDTAQLRSSVISQAKLLGYIPGSIGAARATVVASFLSTGSPATGSTLTIPSGTKFGGSSANGTYTYISQGTATATYASLSSTSNAYTGTINLIQGVQRSQSYQVDKSIGNQKFIIEDPSADISTLAVLVYANQNETAYAIYSNVATEIANSNQNLNAITPASQIYYLSLNSAGNYEVTFGDGVLGKALDNLNVVQLNYISTQGSVTNGIAAFELTDSLIETGVTPNVPIAEATITLINSINGSDAESTDSIRLNAPASLISQNRAVTANDYITILKQKFPTTTAVNVWGGEDEVVYDPINAAQYAGKVFISIVPAQGQTTIGDAIKPYKVMSITPVVYDADFINLYMNINFKYNPNLTTQLATTLQDSVKNVISAYNSSSLQSFTGVFRSSNLLRQIDTSNPAILNSDIQLSFYKTYELNPIASATDVTSVATGINAIPNALVTTYGNTLAGSISQVTSMVSSDGIAITAPSMTKFMPSSNSIQVIGSYSNTSQIVTIKSSPGITSAQNTFTNPYLVVGAIVTSSGFLTGTASITAITNVGTLSVLTISIPALATDSAGTMYIYPPAGTYYLKDAADPESTTTRRLFMSSNSSTTVLDPKYVSSGSDINIGTLYPSTGKIELYRYFRGTVTSAAISGQSITDTACGGMTSWLTDQFKNCVLYFTAGTGAGNTRTITSNSSNTLYWDVNTLTLDSTSQYTVIRSCINGTTTGNVNIYSRPASNDVAPSRHQLLSISSSVVTATADSFAQSGVLGATNYSTFSRDPQ